MSMTRTIRDKKIISAHNKSHRPVKDFRTTCRLSNHCQSRWLEAVACSILNIFIH